MIDARFDHHFEVVSRSGRAAATLGRADLDDEDSTDAVLARMAAIAHRPSNDAERHEELREALGRALADLEEMPGNPRSAQARMEDGRSARVTRTITI